MSTDEKQKVSQLAKDLVLIERKSFYGSEPERDRLKKMRELIDKVAQEVRDDS
jgi:hypothetical protein